MQRVLLPLCVGVLAFTSSVQAGDGASECVPTTIAWVDKTVTCMRPEWRERDVTCTINRVVMREVIVPVKRVVMVPEFREVQKTIIVPKLVAREVEREVISCRMVPSCVTDPCTGCSVTVCKPELVTHRVRCVVTECVPEQKQITVRMCTPKPVEETVQCRKLVCEIQPQQVTRRECYCVMVPHEMTVKVPVCVPCR